MNIKLIQVAAVAVPDDFKDCTAVVFDVLRATSTIVTAIASGFKRVYPVVDEAEARRLASERGYVLAGERGGQIIPGFPHGNSPMEYCRGPAGGNEVLVLTTSNGTAAIRKAGRAEKVVIGSIINARAAARAAVENGRDIRLVCAGSGGRYSLDDVLGAGFVMREIIAFTGGAPLLDDLARTALCLAGCYSRDPLAGLMDAGHGKKLVHMGMENDLRWCARLNLFDLAPVFDGDCITAS